MPGEVGWSRSTPAVRQRSEATGTDSWVDRTSCVDFGTGGSSPSSSRAGRPRREARRPRTSSRCERTASLSRRRPGSPPRSGCCATRTGSSESAGTTGPGTSSCRSGPSSFDRTTDGPPPLEPGALGARGSWCATPGPYEASLLRAAVRRREVGKGGRETLTPGWARRADGRRDGRADVRSREAGRGAPGPGRGDPHPIRAEGAQDRGREERTGLEGRSSSFLDHCGASISYTANSGFLVGATIRSFDPAR